MASTSDLGLSALLCMWWPRRTFLLTELPRRPSRARTRFGGRRFGPPRPTRVAAMPPKAAEDMDNLSLVAVVAAELAKAGPRGEEPCTVRQRLAQWVCGIILRGSLQPKFWTCERDATVWRSARHLRVHHKYHLLARDGYQCGVARLAKSMFSESACFLVPMACFRHVGRWRLAMLRCCGCGSRSIMCTMATQPSNPDLAAHSKVGPPVTL